MGPLGAASFVQPFESLVALRRAKQRLLPWREESSYVYLPRNGRPRPVDYISPDLYNKRLYNTLDRVGMPRAFTPHDMRHAFGTNMADMGVRVKALMELMGHRSIQTTQRYMDVANDPLAEMIEHQGFDRRTRAERWGLGDQLA